MLIYTYYAPSVIETHFELVPSLFQTVIINFKLSVMFNKVHLFVSLLLTMHLIKVYSEYVPFGILTFPKVLSDCRDIVFGK